MLKKPKGWLKSGWDETQVINARLTSRAGRWDALYHAGGGTINDYMCADFNTDCPEGLDTQPWADQSIRLESLFQSENYKKSGHFNKISSLRWGGWVQWDQDDTIHINPLWYSPLSLKLRGSFRMLRGKDPLTMADIIPHEFIHTRQHHSDHSGWMRNNDGNDIEYLGMHDLSKYRQIWRKAVRTYLDATTAVLARIGTTSGYYARNVEIQARMHEVLAYGYAQWQRLPVSKIELWAALNNIGLKAPDSILDELNNTAAGQKALEDFKILSGIKSTVSGTVSTFNRIHDYVGEPEIQEALWTAKFPLLYGELIEFYGDKMGRERMGMGSNPRPAIEVFYELKKHTSLITHTTARELASQIPPSIAAAFLNNIIIEYPEGAENFENAMHLSEELLNRDDVKDVLFADNQTIRNYIGQYEDPPLNLALLRGHVAMTGMLIRAGADPFQRYTMIDMRGKLLFSSCPLSCVNHILINEKNLANPDLLPREDRKYYKDPENREKIAQGIEKKRAALQEMIRSSHDPDLRKKLFDYEGNYEETSLNQVLSKIGIIKKRTGQDPDMSFEVT
jgi:hypothetical protein